jgi:hypothetical protein
MPLPALPRLSFLRKPLSLPTARARRSYPLLRRLSLSSRLLRRRRHPLHLFDPPRNAHRRLQHEAQRQLKAVVSRRRKQKQFKQYLKARKGAKAGKKGERPLLCYSQRFLKRQILVLSCVCTSRKVLLSASSQRGEGSQVVAPLTVRNSKTSTLPLCSFALPSLH